MLKNQRMRLLWRRTTQGRLRAGLVASLLVFGCNSSCPHKSWCDGNTLWESVGRASSDFGAGCDEWPEEDCGMSGKICVENVSGGGAGCLYPEKKCTGGVESYCDDNTLVVCDTVAEMGESLIDCDVEGKVCAQRDDNYAACTYSCEGEGTTCNADGQSILQCMNGFWFHKVYCTFPHKCKTVGQDQVSWLTGRSPTCVKLQSWCSFRDDFEAGCDGNVSYDRCDDRVYTEDCPGGCTTFLDADGRTYIYCEKGPITDAAVGNVP